MQLQALSPAIHTESSDKTRLEIEHLDSLMCEYRELTERPGTAHQLGPDALALAKSLGLPPVLTYEALILMNPLDTAPRTFLTDEVGRRDEIAFYRIHFEIERMLYPSIRMLIDTLSHVRPNSESFAPIGQALNESLQETKRKMGEMFRTLGVDSFARMRPYFMADPGRTDAEGRTYPGPSGASSAAFPTIDLLLGISSNESPDKDAIRPISPWRGYVTVADLNEARDLARSGRTVASVFTDSGSRALAASIAMTLSQFRQIHAMTAKRYVPELVDGGVGTGGVASPLHYLQGLTQRTKHAAENLASSGTQ